MAAAAGRMSAEDRARFQVRLVQVVYRGEARRLHARRLRRSARETTLNDLRRRCLELLDLVRSSLDHSQGWHADVLALVADVEREIRE